MCVTRRLKSKELSALLQFEALEPRNLFAADAFSTIPVTGDQPLGEDRWSVAPMAVANVADDAYEENDTRTQAYNLGVLTTPRTISGLRMLDQGDWFRFRQSGSGNAGSEVRITFQHSRGDLDMALFDAAGTLLARADGYQNFERISLNNRDQGVYFVRVYGYGGASNPSYTLSIVPGTGIPDDAYEDNDTLATAANLGTITTPRTITGLRMADNSDWFRFRQIGTGNSGDFIRINFQHRQGDLDLALFDSAGQLIRRSDGITNSETISLDGVPAGDYYVRVYGFQGARNPDYSLTVDPAAQQTIGSRVLYLNFDGANMSAADMRRWGGADWNPSHFLDRDGNGTRVQPLFPARADREQIIQGILANVRADLSPFGITVQRHYGLAVENVGATTIFVGRSDLGNNLYHVACDIDYGNNNRTDIAFVGDEDWGSIANSVLALSDVVLHEAGHTYGLFHVNTVQNGTIYAESMGLRYSTSWTNWLRDTSFMNRTFSEYSNHGGGRGSQNSYQVMRANFGLNGQANPQSIAGWMITDGVFHVMGSAQADRLEIRAADSGLHELVLNGQRHTIGSGIRSVVLHSAGDYRDQLITEGPLAIRVIANHASDGGAMFASKLSPSELRAWNGSAVHRQPGHAPCGCPACSGAVSFRAFGGDLATAVVPVQIADRANGERLAAMPSILPWRQGTSSILTGHVASPLTDRLATANGPHCVDDVMAEWGMELVGEPTANGRISAHGAMTDQLGSVLDTLFAGLPPLASAAS